MMEPVYVMAWSGNTTATSGECTSTPVLMVSVFTGMLNGKKEQWSFPLEGDREVVEAYIAEKVSEFLDRYMGGSDGSRGRGVDAGNGCR